MSESTDWRGTRKLAGVAFVMTGVFWLGGALLYPTGGLFYLVGEEALKGLVGKKLLFEIQLSLFGGGGITTLIGVPALYLALKEIRRGHALISSLLLGVTGILVIVQTAVYHPLGAFSDKYSAVTEPTQRAAYVAAADLILEHVFTFEVFISIVFGSAVLIASLAMLKGVFSKPTAYLGIVAGVLELIRYVIGYVPGIPSHENVSGHLLAFVWLILVGHRLLSLGAEGTRQNYIRTND